MKTCVKQDVSKEKSIALIFVLLLIKKSNIQLGKSLHYFTYSETTVNICAILSKKQFRKFCFKKKKEGKKEGIISRVLI